MTTFRASQNSRVGEPPSKAAGLMYGIGLGGFVDGIVLHQLLQWHHMVSDVADYPVTTVTGLEINTLADGFFHVATWLFVVGASVVTLAQWRQGRLAPNWKFHLGGVVMGWGLFNVVEGLVDHQLLGVHHVRDDLGGPLSWDIGLLLFGCLDHRRLGVATLRRGSARTAEVAAATERVDRRGSAEELAARLLLARCAAEYRCARRLSDPQLTHSGRQTMLVHAF